MNYTYTELKELIKETDSDTVRSFLNDDFYTNNNFLLIRESDAINKVREEYNDDRYILGSFKASFLSDYIDIDIDCITVLQENGMNENIGDAIIENGNFNRVIEDFVKFDGFGIALGSSNGDYEEIELTGKETIIKIEQ